MLHGSMTKGTIWTHCIVETGNRLDSTIRSNGGASKNKKYNKDIGM